MAGLVEQLQAEALDRTVPIAMLLRKAKLAAVKLKLADAVKWIDAELEGYNDEPPPYRNLRGSPKVQTSDGSWHSIPTRDEGLAETMSKKTIYEAVTSLEVTLASGNSFFLAPLPARVAAAFENVYNASIVAVAVEIPASAFAAIIERVRDLVFNWVLELETAGVVGDGLSFSGEERTIATNAHISIANFSGNLSTGNVSGPNARVNLGSQDQSTNMMENQTIFKVIERTIRTKINDADLRDKLLTANLEMERANTSGGLVAAYQKFVGLAADHIGLFGPMLPALTALLTGHGS